MNTRRLGLSLAAAGLPLLLLVGCHSAFVQATVVNDSGKPIRIFEVDYPNASFGAGNLAAGAHFRYRFKILDTGGTKLTWTDEDGTDHTAQGPPLHQGQEGSILITIHGRDAGWETHLHEAR